MKAYLWDVVLYGVYGSVMGLIAHALGVESRDGLILSVAAMALMGIVGEFTKRVPRS